MGKYLFIMICAFLSSLAGKVSAQRYLPGQTGLELTMGGVDDFAGNVKRLRGNFQVGLALSCYNRNRSRWVFGADYVKKHYAYKKIAVPKEQFTWRRMSVVSSPAMSERSVSSRLTSLVPSVPNTSPSPSNCMYPIR